LKQNSGP